MSTPASSAEPHRSLPLLHQSLLRTHQSVSVTPSSLSSCLLVSFQIHATDTLNHFMKKSYFVLQLKTHINGLVNNVGVWAGRSLEWLGDWCFGHMGELWPKTVQQNTTFV